MICLQTSQFCLANESKHVEFQKLSGRVHEGHHLRLQAFETQLPKHGPHTVAVQQNAAGQLVFANGHHSFPLRVAHHSQFYFAASIQTNFNTLHRQSTAKFETYDTSCLKIHFGVDARLVWVCLAHC
jgi:hypothetical protein